METLASERLRTVRSDDPGPDAKEYWDDVLKGPQGGREAMATDPADAAIGDSARVVAGRVRPVLSLRRDQRLDAVKLYGPHAVWKDVGKRLLDDGCQVRTGRLEEDGCWVAWTG
jgi:hypothetical protein